MRVLAGMILGAFAFPLCAQTDLAPEVLLLARIRHHAASDLSHLPNFTCLETIERSTRHSEAKPFSVRDVVEVEVAHVGGRELFAWPGESKFQNRALGDMIGNGMTSMGDYSSHANSVFLGTAVIHYVGADELGGHRAARYDYEISPAFSGYTVSIGGSQGMLGSRGSFWADTTSFDLLRLTVEGTEIPEKLGIRAIHTEIDYGRLHVGSGNFLLPQSSVVEMDLASGTENRNRIEFTQCRQYTTESVLSFDESSAAAPPPAALTRQVSEFVLPPGATLSLRLSNSMHIVNAKVGDLVSAALASDLKQSGRVVAPAGAVVSGRLRVLQKQPGGEHLVGIEFTSLAFEGKHAPFLARLLAVDARFPRSLAHMELPPDLPGVGIFFLPAGVTEIPKGMPMDWKVISLGK